MDSDHSLHKEIIKQKLLTIYWKKHTIKKWNKVTVKTQQNSDSTIM